MLIFVGWLPHYLYPSRCLPRSRREDLSQPHNVHEGCTHHRGCVSSAGRCRSWFSSTHSFESLRLRGHRPRLGDRPHEGRQLAGDGGGHSVRVLAGREQFAIAMTRTGKVYFGRTVVSRNNRAARMSRETPERPLRYAIVRYIDNVTSGARLRWSHRHLLTARRSWLAGRESLA